MFQEFIIIRYQRRNNLCCNKKSICLFFRQGPAALHFEWIRKLLPKDNQIRQYCQMYKTYSKTETIKEFRNKESRVPWDLMRLTLKYIILSKIRFRKFCLVTYWYIQDLFLLIYTDELVQNNQIKTYQNCQSP